MAIVRKYLWLGTLAFGLVFLAVGILFVVKGLDAKAEVRARLIEQQVYTTKDADRFGVPVGVLVQDAKTAQSQADVIKFHTLGTYGPFQKLDREDPMRQSYFNGSALQAALGLAVLSFGVADLAIGVGAVAILLGIATLGIAVPALLWVRQPELQEKRLLRGRHLTTPIPAGP